MTRVGAAGLLLGAWALSSACGGRSAGSEALGAGGSGSFPAAVAPCAAMDAQSSGDDCTSIDGYAYDGRICAPVVCGCLGADCEALFPSIEACDVAHAACYAAQGLSLECEQHADCSLMPRRCCASCEDPTHDELIAIRVGPATPRATGVCWGDADASCRMCQDFSVANVYAACVEGTCRLLDVSAHTSCTTSADCRISTKDCCECGGDFSADGMIVVNATFRAPDYCPADMGCPECGAQIDPGVSARCFRRRDQDVCGYLSTHIN